VKTEGGAEEASMNSYDRLRNEQGIALLTVLLLMIIMTVLGIAAMTLTGLENRMAGFSTSTEAATVAAEACTGTAVNVIQQTLDAHALPASLLSNATPAGPVPQSNSTVLNQEIMGQSDNNTDLPEVAPNIQQTVGAYTVRGDIDRLYVKGKAGTGMQMFAGAEGTGSGAGAYEVFYRVDCVARNTATNAAAQVTAVYACSVSGDMGSCQK
jgi:Tfp pilus assembly protein PilX